MSDIKLFRYGSQGVSELEGRAAVMERQLQQLIEQQMTPFLGVRLLASEYGTGKTHRGRIDSLGLDENGCPVIIEYKRHSNENVINQGLFYLDWLLDHQAEFRWLVLETLGKEAADNIEWSGTRLLCIASDFTRYDQHAVQQINRNVELIRYKLFADDLLMLELVNAVSVSPGAPVVVTDESASPQTARNNAYTKTHAEQLATAPAELQALFAELKDYVLTLDDEVQYKELKLYGAFRGIRNFCCVCVVPKQDPLLKVWLSLNPANVELEAGFSRDVTQIGHWGTGDLELILRNPNDLLKAKPLIERAYRDN